MRGNSTTVTADLQVELLVAGLDHEIPLRSSWSYDAGDPYAVHVDFRLPLGSTERWSFARELLAQGMDLPAGSGDVEIAPEVGHRHVLLLLHGGSGSAVVRVGQHPLREFLDTAFAHVPAGSERSDDELEQWLRSVLDAAA
ncbi:SsgA family sporulation/cell division regulator [Kitasatospora nipponensis]|uniref:SsgA family sporulation/cell division regulator n=1 Tax=Kitasatospora nipponensis TaxID=258049 RepID=A0ABN1W8G0_9ACTN